MSSELENILLGFVLCNNLRKKKIENSEEFVYEGSSPDEIALGDFAKQMFFEIEERDEVQFKIKDYKGNNK